MLLRDHIRISVLSTFLPAFLLMVMLSSDNLTYAVMSWVIVMGGIFIGSLMPDTDVENSPRGVIRSVRALGITSMIIFISFLVLLGLLFLIGNTVGADGLITVEHLWYAVGVVGGVMVGGILHLFEDSCTVSGIHFINPDSKRIAGTIRTGNKDDQRPKKFAEVLLICYIIIFGILLVPMYVLHGQVTLIPILENTEIMFGTSIIAVVIAWVVIFMWAEVKVTTAQLN